MTLEPGVRGAVQCRMALLRNKWDRLLSRKYPDLSKEDAEQRVAESVHLPGKAGDLQDLVTGIKQHLTEKRAAGFPSTRKGRPPISLQTIINRVQKVAAVTPQEAMDAARLLDNAPSRRSRLEKYRTAAMIGGTLNPVVRGVGRAAEGFVAARPGQRASGALRGLLRTSKAEATRHVVEGALAGGGVRAVQEGAELGRAKKKLVHYLEEAPDVTKAASTPAQRKLPMKRVALPPLVDDEIEYEV